MFCELVAAQIKLLINLKRKKKTLTVNFESTAAETASPRLAALKEPVVDIPGELFELQLGSVDQINPSLTQDGRSDPALSAQRHEHENHWADAQYGA